MGPDGFGVRIDSVGSEYKLQYTFKIDFLPTYIICIYQFIWYMFSLSLKYT